MRGMLAAALGLIVLAGCTAAQRPLAPGAAPTSSEGFLAVDITDLGIGFPFGLDLEDDKGAKQRIVLRTDFSGSERQTALYPIHPGAYRLTGWFVFDIPLALRKPIDDREPVARPFVVQPGHVVYLAEFLTDTAHDSAKREWHIRWMPVRADEAVARARKAYPAFSAAPVECVICTPAPDGAAEYALPAQTPAAPAFRPAWEDMPDEEISDEEVSDEEVSAEGVPVKE